VEGAVEELKRAGDMGLPACRGDRLTSGDFDLIHTGITHTLRQSWIAIGHGDGSLHLARKIETSVRSSRAPERCGSPLSQCDLRHILS